MGYIAGKAGDIGIDDKFIKQVGDSLEPGGAALFMLVIEATPDKVLEQMQKFGGDVLPDLALQRRRGETQ